MANLETLELTINGSATSASQGIDKLITSLSSLSEAIVKPYSDLVDFNTALKKMRDLCSSIKMPNLAKVTGAARAVASPKKSKEEILAWQRSYANERTFSNGMGFMGGYQSDAERRAKNPQWYQDPVEQAKKAAENLKNSGGVASWAEEQTKALSGWTQKIKELFPALNKAGSSIKSVGKATKESADEAEKSKSKWSQLGGTIGRIFKMMVIRTAIRALIKSFTQAWNSAYAFSKKMNGSFAQSVDKIKGSLQSMAINLVRAFAPLVQVLSPVFSVIASGIRYLSDAIIGLLKLLGVVSDMFGATAENISAVGASSNQSSKDILASFDELNVISDKSSGSGGGSGGKSDFLKGFEEEIASVKMIVAESLLAVGLILAFSGHTGVGLALAAVGAATIAGTVITQWGSLSDKVKGEITGIMAIAGGSMLALGAIIGLACPTKLGLGIALMAAGAANLATSVGLSWGLDGTIKGEMAKITAIIGGALLAVGAIIALACPSKAGLGIGLMVAGATSMASAVALAWGLDGNIRAEIAKITAIIGGALLAIGAIIALACPSKLGIGLGLMIAGAASLASSVALSWGLDGNIRVEVAKITAIVGGALLALGAIIAFACPAKLGIGIGLMVAGAASLASAVAISWGGLDENVKTSITKITSIVGGGLLAVGAILALTGANIPLGIGMMAAGGVALASAVALNWDSLKDSVVKTFNTIKEKISAAWNAVKTAVSNAWDAVKTWAEAKWENFKAAWNIIKSNLVLVWGNIKDKVSAAWDAVKKWAEAKWESFKQGWDQIKKNLSEAWDKVKNAVSDAWAKVGDWISAKWENFKSGWNVIKSNLSLVWSTIKDKVKDAWDFVQKWLNEKWENFKQGWELIKTGFSNIWSAIGDKVSDAWNAVSNWASAKWENLKAGWEGIKEGLAGVWSTIEQGVTDAWDAFVSFCSNPLETISNAWQGVSDWFYNNVIAPIQKWWHSIFGGEDGIEPVEISPDMLFKLSGTFSQGDVAIFNEIFDGTTFDLEGLPGLMRKILEENLTPAQIEVADVIGFTGWDLLEEGLKSYFIKSVEVLYPKNLTWLKKAGIPALDIVRLTDWTNFTKEEQGQFISAIVQAFGANGIEALKSKFPEIKASDIANVTEWGEFTAAQGLNFLNALKEAFGAKEALEAAKASGVDIGKYIEAGLKSNDPEIVKLAQEWNKLIQTNVEKPTPKVTPEIKEGQPKIIADTLKKAIEDTQAKVDKVKAAFEDGYPDNLGIKIGKVEATVDKVDAKFKKGNPDNLGTDVGKVSATVSDITASFKKDYPGNLAKVVEGVQATVSDITSVFKKGSPDNLKTSVESVTGTVSASAGWKKDNPGNLKTNVEDLSPTITTATKFASNSLTDLVNLIQILAPVVQVATNIEQGTASAWGTLVWLLSLIQSIAPVVDASAKFDAKQAKGALNAALSGILVTITVAGILYSLGSLTFKANGGFVDSGDVFVANENGSAEMIGSFGHSTAVANNDQIVAGIAAGVREAESEQNALLRQQNALLRGILEKDSSVRIGASAELGRVTRQSLNMYSGLVGG